MSTAVSGQTIVVPGPFVANLVTRNRWFRWGSNRFAISWRFSRLTWNDLRQQGRGGQKLDLEMIKGVPPLNQTKFEGTQHLVMKGPLVRRCENDKLVEMVKKSGVMWF